MPLVTPLSWSAALGTLPPQRHAVLVSVVAHAGSVPRIENARMLVTPRRSFDTIGGGHLEWKALASARAWLNEDGADVPSTQPAPRFEKLALGPSLGQCCGGVVELRYDRLDLLSNASYTQLIHHFLDERVPAPHLFVFGAGHVARALMQILEQTPCEITWVDERDQVFPENLSQNLQVEATDTPEALIADAAPNSYFLVMTHHHGLDLRLTEEILKREDLAWFGLIGSRTKRANFIHRLKEKGYTQQQIDRMVCPIGDPQITGKEPGIIALAVASQLWQLWRREKTTPHLQDGSYTTHHKEQHAEKEPFMSSQLKTEISV